MMRGLYKREKSKNKNPDEWVIRQIILDATEFFLFYAKQLLEDVRTTKKNKKEKIIVKTSPADKRLK